MMPDRGGIRRFFHPLAGSLLLHLALFGVFVVLVPPGPMKITGQTPLIVAYPVLHEPHSIQQGDRGVPRDSAPPTRQHLQSGAAGASAHAPVSHDPAPLPVQKHRAVEVAAPPSASKETKHEVPLLPAVRTIATPVSVPLATAGTPSPGTTAHGPASQGSGGGTAGGASLPAAGSGSGRSGVSATKGHRGGSPGRIAAYEALLRRLIEEHKRYPFAARKAGREGSCRRRFTVARDGSLMSVETLSSCGSGLLDAAATSAIMEVTMFPPLPEDFAGGEASFTIPITFTFTRE